MFSDNSKKVAEEARRIYDSLLREQLEPQHSGKYVSIEPNSGRYFLGESFDQAVNSALDAFPDRLTFTLRVGHSAALNLGVLSQ